jgi:hypothetical protein
MNDPFPTLEPWLRGLSSQDRTGMLQLLVTRLWALHRELQGKDKADARAARPVRDHNHGRKQAALKAAVAREWETPRANGAPELANQQLAWRDKCKARMSELGAAGLYIPQTRKGYIVAMHAVWQLPDGSWLTPDTPKPPCCFEQLHASLSLPRVPVAGGLDPACLITDF